MTRSTSVIPSITSASSSLTFCENITPTTYTQARHSLDHLEDLDLDALNELQASLLPGFEPNDPTTTKKRRGPPHRRRSQGHIPRPPNAFMMFRQNFCKSSRFRPGMTDERDSLSRLLGKEWRELPAEEKSYWDLIAKIEKERHRRLYPDYKFKPVHKKRNLTDATSKQGTKRRRTTNASVTNQSSFPMDVAKQRELQLERNSYITELYKQGLKTDQLGPFMDRFEEYHRHKALGLVPLRIEDLDASDSHSDSATVFDDADGLYNRKLKFDHPSPSGSHMSSPATLAYSLAGSPPPLTLPTLPRLPSLVHEEPFTASSSGWGFQHLRRSSSVPPPFVGHWEDGLLNPANFVGSAFSSTNPTPPLSPPPIPMIHPGFLPGDMDLEYSQMSAEHRSLIGERRASSAGGMRRSWGSLSKFLPSSTYTAEDLAMSSGGDDQWGWMQGGDNDGGMVDDSELPEVEPGLFQPNFDLSAGGLGVSSVSPLLEGSVSPLDAPSPLAGFPPSCNAEEVHIIAPQPVSPVPLQSFEGLTLPVSADSPAMVNIIHEDGLVYPLEDTNESESFL